MTSVDPLRVGIVGLGAFGSRVAMRLLWNGYHTLGVYDCNDMTSRLFSNEYGAMGLGSPRMVAQTCDVVITVLPTADALREVCFGWESIAKGFGGKGLVIDLGVTDPVETQSIAREFAAKGISFIDAPAFGSPAQAKEGALTLVVGGDDDAVEIVSPILNCLSNRMIRAGGSGSAQAASAIADYLHAAELLATCEAIRLGTQFGFQPETVLGICNILGGAGLQALISKDLVTRKFQSGRKLGHVQQNIAIASHMAAKSSMALPLLSATGKAWADAESQFGFGADQTEILKWLEKIVPFDNTTVKDAPVAEPMA